MEQLLIKETNALITITSPRLDPHHHIPEMSLNLQLATIDAQVSENHLIFLLQLLDENILVSPETDMNMNNQKNLVWIATRLTVDVKKFLLTIMRSESPQKL